MHNEKISKGVNLCHYKTEKFKTSQLSFFFISPLAKTSAEDSLIINLLARTCGKYPTIFEMNRKLASLYGVTLSPGISKIGESVVLSLNMTMLDNRFAINEEKICRECVDLLCSCIFRPNVTPDGFNKSDVEREKRLLIEKIESENDDKRVYALNKMTGEMCANEAYGLSKYGDIERIKALTEKELFSRWLRLIVNCPIHINYVGSANIEEVKEIILPYFEQIKRNAVWPIKTDFIPDAFEQKCIKEAQKVNQGKLVIGYRAGMSYDRDNYPAVKLMTMIFGGGTFSKLFTNVREKLSLCYYCSARLFAEKGIIAVESGVETKNVQKAIKAIRNELDEIRKGNFSDETLKHAKLSFCDSVSCVYDSCLDINSWLLSYSINSVFYTPDEICSLINAVSREEIIVAAQMISEDTIYILEAEAAD